MVTGYGMDEKGVCGRSFQEWEWPSNENGEVYGEGWSDGYAEVLRPGERPQDDTLVTASIGRGNKKEKAPRSGMSREMVEDGHRLKSVLAETKSTAMSDSTTEKRRSHG